jgi:hypothetical protein
MKQKLSLTHTVLIGEDKGRWSEVLRRGGRWWHHRAGVQNSVRFKLFLQFPNRFSLYFSNINLVFTNNHRIILNLQVKIDNEIDFYLFFLHRSGSVCFESFHRNLLGSLSLRVASILLRRDLLGLG